MRGQTVCSAFESLMRNSYHFLEAKTGDLSNELFLTNASWWTRPWGGLGNTLLPDHHYSRLR